MLIAYVSVSFRKLVDIDCPLLAQSRHSRFLSCLVICVFGSVDNMRTQPLIITHDRTGNMKKIDTTYKTIRKGRQRYVYYPKTHMVNEWLCYLELSRQ